MNENLYTLYLYTNGKSSFKLYSGKLPELRLSSGMKLPTAFSLFKLRRVGLKHSSYS